MPTKPKNSVRRRPVSPAASSTLRPAQGRSPAEAYQHFLLDAEKLAEAELLVCRADLSLCLHNVQLGVASVLPHQDRLRKELPALKLDPLRSLPDLAAGLIYAAGRIGGPPAKTEVAAKLERLRRLREPMLLVAEGLALHGLLPTEEVTSIRAGKGAMDAARDGIALEALYREHAAALRNKHPFSAADLKEVADLGSYLVRAITPDGGRQRPEAPSKATVLRDRFYTLLTRGHAELRKAGFYLFGEALDAHVPSLQARVLGPRKPTEPPPAPQPSPT